MIRPFVIISIYNAKKVYLIQIEDAVTADVRGFNDFKNKLSRTDEYRYDQNGNMNRDLNKDLNWVTYNSLNLPQKLQFVNGNKSEYSYDASGVKRRAKYSYSVAGIQMPINDSYTENNSISSISVTDYCGNYIYENNSLKRILTPEGYIAIDNGNRYSYFLKDHLGDTRVNISASIGSTSCSVDQTTHYYPFGLEFYSHLGDILSGSNPYLYNSKEMDRVNGLNMLDYGARWYDATIGRWSTIDPLTEKYYNVSPFVYCTNNPINAIDVLGMDTMLCKTLPVFTVTATAPYKQSWSYMLFGELTFGSRKYLSEHSNPYIFTNKEITNGVNAELQAGLMVVGGVSTAAKVASIGWRSLKGLDIAMMAGKALGDAIGQFGGNMIKGQVATQALANINLVSPVLSGLGVDPLSASALSSGIDIRVNSAGIETNSDKYLFNTAMGTALGFAGDGIGNLSQYKSMTIGIQMRTALSINPSTGVAAAVGATVAPSILTNIGSTSISK